MKRLLIAIIILQACISFAGAQTANSMGVDVATPQQKVDVNGAVKIGTTSNTNAGTIRYTGSDVEGYMGGQWVSLTGKGRTITVENWNNNDTYSPGAFRDVTGYSPWLNVKAGDILKVSFSLSCRMTSGSGDDDFDFTVIIDGDGACADGNTEYLYYRPYEDSGERDNFKPVSYMDIVTVSCTGRMRFKISVRNSGDDNFGIRDRSLIVTKY